MAVKPAVKQAATATAVKLRLVGTIGAMTDQLVDLREQKRGLEEQIKEIEAKYTAVEEQLMTKLEAEGTDKGAGKKGSVSVSTTVVANVLDWDAFWAWIVKTKNTQVIQRRVSDAAWRELAEQKGIAPPGTQAFNKKRLNVRTA